MRRPLVTAGLLLAIAGCAGGDGSPTPGFEPVTEAKDAGPGSDAAPEAWSPSGPPEPPAAEPDAGAAPDVVQPPPLPVVWTARATETLPCHNRQHAFDFDPSNHDFSATNAFWMMWLAMRAFDADNPTTREELASLGFGAYETFDDGWSGLQALVAGSDELVLVGFKGSTEVQDYFNNAKFGQVEGQEVGLAGRLHAGFGEALGDNWEELYEIVEAMDGSKSREVWLSGHSLGGTMALLTAVRLVREGHRVGGVYSFAGPRAGDSVFANDALFRLEGRTFRIVNDLDLTPRIPPAGVAAEQAAQVLGLDPIEGWAADLVADLDYAHGSTMYRFDEGNELSLIGTTGDWEDQVYWEERADQVGNLVGLVKDDRDHSERHDHRTYLCKMQALMEAGGK